MEKMNRFYIPSIKQIIVACALMDDIYQLVFGELRLSRATSSKDKRK